MLNENNRPIATRFGIRGFPTLKIFRHGEYASDYVGDRSADAIVSYMKKQALPAISELTADKVDEFSGADRVVIVGFFSSKDSADYTLFSETADSLRDKFVFGAVFGDKGSHVSVLPSVVIFKKFDEGKNILEADISDLKNFILSKCIPLIDEIGPDNYKTYAEAGIPLGYLFVDLTVSGQMEEYVNRLKDVANSYKGKINFVYIDSSKYGRHAERLGLSTTVVPSLAIEETESGKHWAFNEKAELTAQAIGSWVAEYASGKLEPTIRSEDIPEPNDQPVKVVVANNFDDLVLKSGKDVLVEFYAPWCGHCKKLAPIYDELAAKYSSNNKLTIAKIDATANDVDPKLGIRGFPTLKLFLHGNPTPVDYDGDRSLENLSEFLEKNALNAFSQSSKQEL